MIDPLIVAATDRSLLNATPLRVYKDDGRTRVWSVKTIAGILIVKRFERSGVRQWFAAMLGIHPAQLEAKRTSQLRAAGLAVPPILAQLFTRGKLRHVYPFAGKSLLWRLRDRDLTETGARRALIESLAKVVAALLEAGWAHGDFKTSNVLVDDAGVIWLIDVGAVKRLLPGAAGAQQVAHMLATLDVGARLDGVSQTERVRFLRHLTLLRPELGDLKALAREVGRIVLK